MSEPVKKNDAMAKLDAIKAKLAQSKANLDKFKAGSDANKASVQAVEEPEKRSPPPLPPRARRREPEETQENAPEEKERLEVDIAVVPKKDLPPAIESAVSAPESTSQDADDHDSLFDVRLTEPIVQEQDVEADPLFSVVPTTPRLVQEPEVVSDEVALAKEEVFGAFKTADPKTMKTMKVDPLSKPQKPFKEMLVPVYDFLENNLEKVAGPVAGGIISAVAALYGAGAIAVVPLLVGSAISGYYTIQDKTKGETQ